MKKYRNTVLPLLTLPFLSLWIQAASSLSFSARADGDLAEGFQNPPHEAKAGMMWYWIRGNVTEEGIDADLEAMAESGIRVVHLMHIGVAFTAPGPVTFLSPEYERLLQHTFKRARELGLVINLYNCEGFSSAGGPWMTPPQSMQRLVWTETRVSGPATQPIVLPQPYTKLDYYRDEAVVAFPAPAAERVSMAEAATKIHNAGAGVLDPAVLADWGRTVELTRDPADKAVSLRLDFAEPYTARSLFALIESGPKPGRVEVLASDDGESYRSIATNRLMHDPGYVSSFAEVVFDAATARHFKILMHGPNSIRLAHLDLSGGVRLPDWTLKAGYILGYKENGRWAAAVDQDGVVDLDQVIDLTGKLEADGNLDWEVPPGEWIVLRFGMTSTTMENRPAGPGGLGLESDKFSTAATDRHFDGYLGRTVRKAGPLAENILTGTHVDSWEVGPQNWNPDFAGEFASRQGYDLRKFMPVMTGRVLNDARFTERFLWDLRKNISDLVAENFYGRLRERANEHGIQLSVQAQRFLFDSLQVAGEADIPFANVQMGRSRNPSSFIWAKGHSSAGNLYGKPVISSESLTARPEDEKWDLPPWHYKPYNDLDFTGGVNHQALHVYTHQPWTEPEVVPGMTLNPWGLHIQRSNTWWPFAKPWFSYLQRTQHLLQQSRFVGDVLVFMGDDGPRDPMNPPWLRQQGFDFDLANADVILNFLSVDEKGDLVTESGMRYRILALTDREWMRPEVLRKIHQLVADGATVHGLPPAFSPSLRDYPQVDDEVARLAANLWKPGETVVRFGKGSVFSGVPLQAALQESGIVHDFLWQGKKGDNVGWIHRQANGTDLYFVANHEHQPAGGIATFRVNDRDPELWDPLTGERFRATEFTRKGAHTEIPLHLNPVQSVFVVFPPAPTTEKGVTAASSITHRAVDLQERLTVPGPWQVRFEPNRGAPEGATFAELIDWTTHDNEGIRFFSGRADYQGSFDWTGDLPAPGERIFLDLGEVREMAEVTLNGKPLGQLWIPPFRVDVTDALVRGENQLDVQVVNLWPNRLIGDERQFPNALRFVGQEPRGPALAEWPDWLQRGERDPSGRITLTTWKHWLADDDLFPSGLLGPVRLLTVP
jgi:hypothetical protein